MEGKNEKTVPPKMKYFDYVSPQAFPLPKPIINYLIKYVNAESIKKLQQTCRYFYSKLHYSIIDDLAIASYYRGIESITNYDIKIQDSYTDFFKNKLYLNKSLFIAGNNPEKFYPKIVKCEIYKLRFLRCPNFLINDFALLAKSGSLKHVEICNVIYYPDKTIVPLEEILSYLPNVHYFLHDACVTTSNTMKKLFTLKRNVKFQFFSVRTCSEFPEIHLLNEYFKETLTFSNPPSTDRHLSLMGKKDDMKTLFELFKTWRKNCSLYDYDGDLLWLYVY